MYNRKWSIQSRKVGKNQEFACMKSFFSDYPSVLYKIKTVHAKRIYNGEKKFELRKTMPSIHPKIIFLYENEEYRAITGGFLVKQIYHLPINELWEVVGEKGTTKKRFFEYYKDHKLGCAFEIEMAFEFSTPLLASEIKSLESKFHYPQSFIYLKKHRLLYSKLLLLLENEYRNHLASIAFEVPNEDEIGIFASLVKREISKNYDEIDDSFIENIVTCTKLGYDPNGYFTTKKFLYAAKQNNKLLGFTVLTEKIGNSVKTGPTILLHNYRRKSFGQLIRKKIEYDYFAKGFRKLYCTCNASADIILQYLLRSGLRVEAHLQNQYKKGSSEFVLGKLLKKQRKVFSTISREKVAINKIKYQSDNTLSEIKITLLDNFEKYYAKIDESFCENLIKATRHSKKESYSKKGKTIFRFYDIKGRIIGIVICSPKRGGAVKLNPILLTEHYESLYKVFLKIEKHFFQQSRSKLYLSLLVNDLSLIGFFNRMGFIIEGLLQEPYKDGVDMVQMGKEI